MPHNRGIFFCGKANGYYRMFSPSFSHCSARWPGIKKAPGEVYLVGGVNPAATYSPGPVGQVPSAMRGLTSVFGKGTGMTPSR